MNYLDGTSINAYSILEEIRKTETEIGVLQYKLMKLQSQLNAEHSKNGGNTYVCKNPVNVSYNL